MDDSIRTPDHLLHRQVFIFIATMILLAGVAVSSMVESTEGEARNIGNDVTTYGSLNEQAEYVPPIMSMTTRRISKLDAPLAPHRATLLDAIARHGPSSPAQLARMLGVDRTTVRHHVRILARDGLVRFATHGRRVLVTLPNQSAPLGPSELPSTMNALWNIVIQAGGTLARGELHRRASHIPHRSRNYALRRLVESGRVEVVQSANVETVRRCTSTAA